MGLSEDTEGWCVGCGGRTPAGVEWPLVSGAPRLQLCVNPRRPRFALQASRLRTCEFNPNTPLERSWRRRISPGKCELSSVSCRRPGVNTGVITAVVVVPLL